MPRRRAVRQNGSAAHGPDATSAVRRMSGQLPYCSRTKTAKEPATTGPRPPPAGVGPNLAEGT